MVIRLLEGKLRQLAKKFPVVSVTGPRQSGKSTLIRHAFPKKPYFSLEDPDILLIAQEDPRYFLADLPYGAIIDEAQYAPALFNYLQGIADSSKKNGSFILSGSQNFLLMQSISQSLAGRVAVLHLLPFSLQELRNSSMKIKNADEWMFLGGYPRLHQRKINPEDFYPSYVQTYLERDVRLLKNIGDLARFQKFLAMCAARTGQEVNLNSLATDCAITVNTAKSWISILQTSFVVYLMQPYFNNFNKRLIKSPKLYFYDTGLACYLLKIKAANQLGTHFLRGGLFENMVVSETLKYYYNNGKVPDIYYWKDKTGHEIDLLIDRGTKSPAAFEIKSGLTRNKEYFINFNYWNKLLGNSENRNAVIYSGTETLRASYGDYIPFNKFDLVLKTL